MIVCVCVCSTSFICISHRVDIPIIIIPILDSQLKLYRVCGVKLVQNKAPSSRTIDFATIYSLVNIIIPNNDIVLLYNRVSNYMYIGTHTYTPRKYNIVKLSLL